MTEWEGSQCEHTLNACKPQAHTLRTALKSGHIIATLRGKKHVSQYFYVAAGTFGALL